ncbi:MULTISPECIES: universal stress protein [Nitrosomonas]|uniref:Universal stress protein n=1 Tax=Nitrosomonas communis TaxID=44574 RepID=A0A0F7KK13_9PROT|nr:MULTISPECIES: universal stress protein [Nitrosomonas]AKH39279.1 universal stress protein [Nitrosomonas communis]TYP90890.1 nucleotide-binding universal stress UspA family protein [Nitrosomonas communis]UVS61499.1 universal stress protein [Nitrosomonas sp. PLL12]
MYRRILVPVDGSTTSNCALQEAIKLAQQHRAQLELVHVFEDILYWVDERYINYAELQETARESSEKILIEAQALVQQGGLATGIKLLEAKGQRTANVIVAEAERWQADLIVIGTHGRTGFSRLLLGSVAEGVVRTAAIPVLLIRGHSHGSETK